MQNQLRSVRHATRSVELALRGRQPVRKTSGGLLFRAALCLMLCAAAFCCKQYYPEGAEVMSQVIFGAEDSKTQMAFASFSDALSQGEPVAQTFSELCNEVFDREKS